MATTRLHFMTRAVAYTAAAHQVKAASFLWSTARSSFYASATLSRRAAYSTAPTEKNILRSPHPDVRVPNMTMADYTMEHFAEYGDNIAMVDDVTGRSTTYGELLTQVKRIASALTRLGVKKGDVILIHSYNIPEFITVLLAASSIGATYATTNVLLKTGELERLVKNVGPKIVFTVPGCVEVFQTIRSTCPTVERIILLTGETPGYPSLTDILQDGGDYRLEPAPKPDMDDIFVLLFSSGTTGLPKAVAHTHRSFLFMTDPHTNIEESPLVPGKSCWIASIPFYHGLGQILIGLVGLRNGVRVVTFPQFELKLYLQAIEKYKASCLHLVPPIITMMNKYPDLDRHDLSSVRLAITAGATISKEEMELFQNRTKIPLKQEFGMTECGLTHANETGCKYVDSIGRLMQNMEGKVVDVVSGEALPANQRGEIVVRGKQVMKCYLNDQKATDETLDKDGWLRTGDVGFYNEDEYFFVVDRIKELIKYKARQVSPAEIEDTLRLHPGVQISAVVGVPDEDCGEVPRAYIVRTPESKVTEQEIQQFIAERMSPEKRLRGGVVFVDNIPVLPSGKIVRRELRERAKTEQLCK